MKTLFLTAFLAFICFTQAAFGCSLAIRGVPKFIEEEFVFIGVVKGYTGPVASKPNSGSSFQTRGLIVDIKEAVFLPETPASGTFEVFPIALFADCSLGGSEVEGNYGLRKTFPIGTEVRVVAGKAILVSEPSEKGIVRLEELPGKWHSISPNTDEKGRSVTSAGSIFNYAGYDRERGRQSLATLDLPSFEMRKDLYRLHKTAGQPERNKILERILRAPTPEDIDLYGVLKNYASSEAEADRYFETNMKTFEPEGYSQYMGVKNARAELIKRGYKKEDVEDAMGKGMSDGAGFTAKEIVKGALKYLPRKN